MHYITQQHKHWCIHACLESISVDQGASWTQALIEHHFSKYFPVLDHAFNAQLIPSVAFHIGLGNCFHLGKGRSYMEGYAASLTKLAILVTTSVDENGGIWGHCLRLEGVSDVGFTALDPAIGQTQKFPWNYLDDHKCLVHVIGRAEAK